jgi:excisionase family DNA binding protein
MEVTVDERLLTAEEVAELLALKSQTVRDAAWRGKLPCVRLWAGKRKTLLRFKQSEIEGFIREQSVPAKSSPRSR